MAHESIEVNDVQSSFLSAMAYTGAKGETKKQMEIVLFGGLKDAGVHEGFKQLLEVSRLITEV